MLAKNANTDEETILGEALGLYERYQETILNEALRRYQNYRGLKDQDELDPKKRLKKIIAHPLEGVVFSEILAGIKHRKESGTSPAIPDPYIRDLFSKVMSGIAKQQNNAMTPEQRSARASKAGKARAAALTPERRSEIASMGAKTKQEIAIRAQMTDLSENNPD